jgi:hypothetical protein
VHTITAGPHISREFCPKNWRDICLQQIRKPNHTNPYRFLFSKIPISRVDSNLDYPLTKTGLYGLKIITEQRTGIQSPSIVTNGQEISIGSERKRDTIHRKAA